MRPEHRLRSRADFRRVLADGTRETASDLVVHVLVRPLGPARIGFVVGRRTGGAVVRNRTKRRLREAIASLAPELAPADVVIVARPGAEKATVADLSRAVRDSIVRAGLLPR